MLVLAWALGACAGAGRARPVTGPEIEVEVDNGLVPGAAVTVRIEGPQGLQQVLGSVPSGARRRFRVALSAPDYVGRYRLVAEGAARRWESPSFVAFAGAHVVWSLRFNTLRVEGAP